ncbi:SLAM family member 9-like isoform X2 [Alligator sinensis]|uniref:SLAM family member 9-like isoform X2 n=1 Tax=Alligator sinensis TaxID=38654 RepID=A0A1U7S7G5_ALLSI|nr:SLAM family member 9-like isoform X2 [Alligator sinensis]
MEVASVPALLLLSSWAGLAMTTAQPTARRMNRVLGGSAWLSVSLPPGVSVKSTEWSFNTGLGRTIVIAEFISGRLEQLDPGDQFGRRLEVPNATTLGIRELKKDDGGLYSARVKLPPATVEDYHFHLAVYELVPAPEIQSQIHPSTLGWCNLTLHCQVPTTAAMDITWGTGDSLQDLARHRVSADGQSLHLALPPGTWNDTYTCSVSNPADRKSTSVAMQSLCLSNTTHATMWTWFLCIGLIVAVAVCFGAWLWRRRRRKAAGRAPMRDCPSEPQYAEIKRRRPPEGDEQILSSPPDSPAQSLLAMTPITSIYAQVQLSTPQLLT